MGSPTRARRMYDDNYYVDITSPWSYAEKLITFTGAAGLGAQGAVPLFEVTGLVIVERIVAVPEVDLVGATATIALGLTGATAQFIAATVATDLDIDEVWATATPDAEGIAIAAAQIGIVISKDIIGTVALAAITAGAIRLGVWFTPVFNGTLEAAA